MDDVVPNEQLYGRSAFAPRAAHTEARHREGLPKGKEERHIMPEPLHCLVVGLPRATFPEAVILAENVAVIAYVDLPRDLPKDPLPGLVVSPLFCREFDALEMIDALGKAGFRGTLRIVAPKLPNRQIVLRELRSRAVWQGMILEMVELA